MITHEDDILIARLYPGILPSLYWLLEERFFPNRLLLPYGADVFNHGVRAGDFKTSKLYPVQFVKTETPSLQENDIIYEWVCAQDLSAGHPIAFSRDVHVDHYLNFSIQGDDFEAIPKIRAATDVAGNAPIDFFRTWRRKFSGLEDLKLKVDPGWQGLWFSDAGTSEDAEFLRSDFFDVALQQFFDLAFHHGSEDTWFVDLPAPMIVADFIDQYLPPSHHFVFLEDRETLARKAQYFFALRDHTQAAPALRKDVGYLGKTQLRPEWREIP